MGEAVFLTVASFGILESIAVQKRVFAITSKLAFRSTAGTGVAASVKLFNPQMCGWSRQPVHH